MCVQRPGPVLVKTQHPAPPPPRRSRRYTTWRALRAQRARRECCCTAVPITWSHAAAAAAGAVTLGVPSLALFIVLVRLDLQSARPLNTAPAAYTLAPTTLCRPGTCSVGQSVVCGMLRSSLMWWKGESGGCTIDSPSQNFHHIFFFFLLSLLVSLHAT